MNDFINSLAAGMEEGVPVVQVIGIIAAVVLAILLVVLVVAGIVTMVKRRKSIAKRRYN